MDWKRSGPTPSLSFGFNEARVLAKASGGQTFGLGMTIGMLIGFALGSYAAFVVGDQLVEAAQSLTRRLLGDNNDPNFELLAQ